MANSHSRTTTFAQLIQEGLLQIGDGYRAKNNELGGTGPIFLRAGHVSDTAIDFAGTERFHAHLAEKVAGKMALAGDAVITTKGNSTGRVTYIREGLPPFVYSPHLSYWRSSEARRLDPRSLYYWSRSHEFRAQLRGLSASTDMAPYLSLQDQRRLRITLPDPLQQQRIGSILGTLDEKIDVNRRTNETLEAMAKALFKSWFVDFDPVREKAAGRRPAGLDAETSKLFPSAFEDSPLGPVPKGWRVGKVRDLCLRVENGGTPKREMHEYWNPPEVRWLTSGEVRQNFIIATENHISRTGFENSSAKMWPPYTTVVALYGATAGVATLLAVELCSNQACCGLLPRSNCDCYVHQTMTSSLTLLQQQARGSAQQNLSQSIVADLPCLLPPVSALALFEQRTRLLYQRCISNLEESRTLATTRDALLPKLLSGELGLEGSCRFVGDPSSKA